MSSKGNLISELGVKKYLHGKANDSYSNISYFDRGSNLEKKWTECSFGCHGPSYRSLRRDATWYDTLSLLNQIDPVLAGFADGIHNQTVHQIKLTGHGIQRTAEGLHLNGDDAFRSVGAENSAVVDLVSEVLIKIINTDLDVIENPLMQSVIYVINQYTSAIPEWVIEEALQQNALRFPNKVDAQLVYRVANLGLVEHLELADVHSAASFLENPAKRIAGKAVGKRVAQVIASIVAVRIARKIMQTDTLTMHTKRKLAAIRRQAKSAKGGLGGFLATLVKTQGFLGHAAKASRQLKGDCPRVWQFLRYQLHGADMAYFLIANPLREFTDRISLLERDPQEFVKVMAALIESRDTPDIFFPKGLQ